jgi:FdhD protein
MNKLGTSQDFKVVKIRKGQGKEEHALVATEVPFTIVGNDVEVATLMCTPSDLKELTIGFLFTSGFINSFDELKAYTLDEQTWRADVILERTPEPAILAKRLYTSGCGKGVMYSNVTEITSRHPLKDRFTVKAECIPKIMQWLLTSSDLHRTTGGVHSAALSLNGEIPLNLIDDVGRHNALDKVIGKGLMDATDFSRSIIVSTGRTSSEILHKSKRSSVPIILSRGAPTHQTILLASEMNLTVVGFARGGGFTIYSAAERIVLN